MNWWRWIRVAPARDVVVAYHSSLAIFCILVRYFMGTGAVATFRQGCLSCCIAACCSLHFLREGCALPTTYRYHVTLCHALLSTWR